MRGVYIKAEYGEQRCQMLQEWAGNRRVGGGGAAHSDMADGYDGRGGDDDGTDLAGDISAERTV